MSAPRRPSQGEAWPGANDWRDFDDDLLGPTPTGPAARTVAETRTSLDPGPESRGDLDLDTDPESDVDRDAESSSDLDRDATFGGDGLPRSPVFGHRRRTHALSAAGAGLAVALALAIHAATEGLSDRRAPVGAGTFAHVAQTVTTHGRAPRTRRLERTSTRRGRASRSARLPGVRFAVPAAPVAHPVLAASPRRTAATRRAAEFGFEQ